MRAVTATALALAGALAIAPLHAQQDPARKVPGGGISAPGWKGRVDPNEAKNGSALNDSKFEGKAGNFTIASGPATIFYNSADAQTGDYTVSATFTEPSYMS